jgi:hypothetical protein
LVQIILGLKELDFVQIKGQVLFKGKIITKMQKYMGSFKKLSQKSFDLHESFLI